MDIENNFTLWDKVKKTIHSNGGRPLRIKEGELWWAQIGQNIGVENNGKNENFRRPVFVAKKINKYSALCIPITSKEKVGEGYIKFHFKDSSQTLMFNQMRTLDTKRFLNKIGEINSPEYLDEIRENICSFIKYNLRQSGGDTRANPVNEFIITKSNKKSSS